MKKKIVCSLVCFFGTLWLGLPDAAQAQSKQAIFENVQIGSELSNNPQSLRGVSGGSKPARQLVNTSNTPTGACVGYIDSYADHQIQLMNYFDDLKLSVESRGDTVLVVKGPGGVWCNDDAVGHNPVVHGEWRAGNYDVWVGSREQRRYYPYRLHLHQQK